MDTQLQREKAHLFKQLHIKGNPLILCNIWDAGTAKTIQAAGAKAIATSSWSVAAAHGYDDGECMPFELALANFKRIMTHVDLPVTIDIEGGYGQTPKEVQKMVAHVIDAGAVGINFEDQIVGTDKLYSIAEQCARIQAIREIAERAAIPLFINARTDVFLKADPAKHQECLEEAINRSIAYADAGADGFFVPGLSEPICIEKLCARSSIPINIMLLADGVATKQFAELGVARISYGPSPYNQIMKVLGKWGQVYI